MRSQPDIRVPVRAIFFAPFRLDAESGRLWKGASELAIRPKTLAVLRHLAENSGRLVTVGDLVHAVWADSHGSAPLVKGCVGEVRKLLGDHSAAPRYIETVGRRGYRFVAPIEVVSTAVASSWASGHVDSTFVGRRTELEQLGSCLEAALTGKRQILFLTGEPGVGKTTLAGHFLEVAAARRELRVARGQCLEHYGPGEPYLPILQALATMCRGPGGNRILDVLSRYAPSWLAQMPSLLSEVERDRLLAGVAGTNRERMLREMCDAVEALAAQAGRKLAHGEAQRQVALHVHAGKRPQRKLARMTARQQIAPRPAKRMAADDDVGQPVGAEQEEVRSLAAQSERRNQVDRRRMARGSRQGMEALVHRICIEPKRSRDGARGKLVTCDASRLEDAADSPHKAAS